MSDPAKYRSKDEVSRMRQEHDPIDQVKKRLIDGGMADENRLKEIDKEIKDIITAAADFAQQSPEPDPAELWTEVYADA
jgi:pyruvate dehydrogenase E1 component alpha subunit